MSAEIAGRLAALQVAKKTVKTLDEQLRQELLEQMKATGSERIAARLPSGEKIGAVSLRSGAVKVFVENEAEFFAWVKENRPDQIREVVQPAYQKYVLEQVKATGAIPPGVGLEVAGETLAVVPAPGAEEAVRREIATGWSPLLLEGSDGA